MRPTRPAPGPLSAKDASWNDNLSLQSSAQSDDEMDDDRSILDLALDAENSSLGLPSVRGDDQKDDAAPSRRNRRKRSLEPEKVVPPPFPVDNSFAARSKRVRSRDSTPVASPRRSSRPAQAPDNKTPPIEAPQRVAALEKSLLEATEAKDALAKDLKRTRAANALLLKESEKASTEKDELGKRAQQLEAELKAAREQSVADTAGHNDKVTEVEAKLKDLREQLATAETNLGDMRAKKEDAERKAQEAKEQQTLDTARHSEKVTEVEAKLKDLREQLNTARTDLEDMRTRNAQLSNEITRGKDLLENKENDIKLRLRRGRRGPWCGGRQRPPVCGIS